MSDLRDVLSERVLLCDGAMGSRIQAMDLDLEKDFQGKENCSEILNLSRPDVIKHIHNDYLAAGSDMILTNSFGGSPITLADFQISDLAFELNKRAAEIAREAADAYKDRARFVLGSIGPGTKLPTLGHLAYDDAEAAFEVQARGLISGGIDAALIETCQDLLQVKAAVNGVKRACNELKRDIPIFVTVTVEAVGTMLVGSDMAAAATVIEALGVDLIGLNCATGPKEMSDNIRWLSQNWPRLIGVQPNAGLPQLVDGKTCYPLGPDKFVSLIERFITEFGVNFVGGCCGTNPAHISAMDAMLRKLANGADRPKPLTRAPVRVPSIASLYGQVPLRQENAFLAIGERCNANGSKQWRLLQEKEGWDGCVEMARGQTRDGSHAIDVCTAFVGRDEGADMENVVRRFVGEVTAPLVIDTTDIKVLERALKLYGGKPIINSINFEDGEGPARERLALARKFGCAVIALTIDETGMAKTPERKLAIAQRLYRLAVEECKLPPEDLLIDPLTFSIATGNEDDRKLALWTLEGVSLIHKTYPKCQIILGLSNVSFGLKPELRHVLNSVMLDLALKRGLTGAILHHTKIMPLHKIPAETVRTAEDLIMDRRAEGYDPLQAFMSMYRSEEQSRAVVEPVSDNVAERLARRIVDGDKNGLIEDLDEALKTYKPVVIINEILLGGMKTVGELFGAGKTQLPFVLQSAETMKAAVAHLEPLMEKKAGHYRGVIVLATVKGDVHDIGKNLVDIILTNNGYRVINLGIKQPIDTILKAAKENNADAIGMSGLLVKSTEIMRENLLEMARQGIDIPVLLGGAALTRKFVENECSEAYSTGYVAYSGNAFDALRLMDCVKEGCFNEFVRAQRLKNSGMRLVNRPSIQSDKEQIVDAASARAKRQALAVDAPQPSFWGTRVLDKLEPKSILPYLNERTLFMQHWGYRKHGKNIDSFMDEARKELFSVVRRVLDLAAQEKAFDFRAVYGFWPVAAEGNELVLFASDQSGQEIGRWKFPRGKSKDDGEPGPCLTDFVHDIGNPQRDVIGLQVVTAGPHVAEVLKRLFDTDRYKDYVYLHGLSVELTEAFAEYVHRLMRADLGLSQFDAPDTERLIKQGYRGCRYSFGYPACPNLDDQKSLLALLQAERIGIELAEGSMLRPEHSTSAFVLHHPMARYFVP